MSMEICVEYCGDCGDMYVQRAIIHAMFNSFGGEIKGINDEYFHCRDCGFPVRRYSGYLESYARQRDPEFLSYIDDNFKEVLSEEALELIVFLIQNCRIPSFCYYMDGVSKRDKGLLELEKENLIQVSVINGKHICVLLNACELGLFDNAEIFRKLTYHQRFCGPRPKKSSATRGSELRQTRLGRLVDDFTEEQRMAISERFEGKCALTGKDVSIQMDHVIPVAIGHGGTTLSNMLPIWQRINSSKGAKNIFEWYKDNGERFEVCPDRFAKVIAYLAELNGMTTEEYRDYVYDCHANPNN